MQHAASCQLPCVRFWPKTFLAKCANSHSATTSVIKTIFFTRVSNANLFVQQLITVHTDRPNVVGQSRSARTNRILRKWKAGIFLTAECSGGRVFFAGRSGWHVYLPSKNTGIVDFPAISRGCATSAKVSPTRENKWRADRERQIHTQRTGNYLISIVTLVTPCLLKASLKTYPIFALLMPFWRLSALEVVRLYALNVFVCTFEQQLSSLLM